MKKGVDLFPCISYAVLRYDYFVTTDNAKTVRRFPVGILWNKREWTLSYLQRPAKSIIF